MKIQCDKNNPPIAGVFAAELYKSQSKEVELVWGDVSNVQLPQCKSPVNYVTSLDLIRILERSFNQDAVPLQKVIMNHWLTFTLNLENEMPKAIEYLDKTLAPLTYLVGESITVSDLAVFSVLLASNKFKEISKAKPPKNVLRWMRLIEAQPSIQKALKELPDDIRNKLDSKVKIQRSSNETTTGRQQEGKFIELPHAEKGKVVVRFPPEASGYLHIGHAKAALLNQYYQVAFEGKLIMRFDDTNPAKENADFEKVILEDVEMLEIKPDLFTHTSQYFDMMLQCCEKLIKEGKAFVDDTPAEQMKSEREQKIDSKNKKNTVEQNLKLWEAMKAGNEVGVQCCVRAIIDMQSTNGCLRDPTIYRCKPEPHPRTGTQYKVYPTYDFACPIVDAVEGVTHVLRTMEYHDRDPQFYWFIDALGLRKPYIWEYSRLSMTNTVLSKRKLTWFVEQGLVDGWDDPRMPTVRGVLRRGMTVEGLRQFIQAQGSSRSVVFMEWDKIWAINKKVIDPIAPRYTALELNPVPVKLKGVTQDVSIKVPFHPKHPDVGKKNVWVSPTLLIDQADAKTLKEGENTTFINYGNVMIDKIHAGPDGNITNIEGTPNLDNKDYKKTLKITWLAQSKQSPMLETYCVYFDHIISKPLLGKDEDFKSYIGHQTRWEVPMLGEPELANLRKGDIIQLQRRGFFRVDVASAPSSVHSGKSRPLILFHVPEGNTKEVPGQPKSTSVKQVSTPKQAAVKATSSQDLDALIQAQGDSVRSLKAAKADKVAVDEAVKVLLDLKAKYKQASGQDWKPGMAPAQPKINSVPSGGDRICDILNKITAQGDKVRKLKSENADKATVDAEVKVLLSLKAAYTSETGTDWTPNAKPPNARHEAKFFPPNKAGALIEEIAKQGDKVRDLKSKKADKTTIDTEVKKLLSLKAEYKSVSGADWTPNVTKPASVEVKSANDTMSVNNTPISLFDEITMQGDKVRDMKAKKLSADLINREIAKLLELKAKYHSETGTAYVPAQSQTNDKAKNKKSTQQVTKTAQEGSDSEAADILAKIAAQGEKVRKIKAEKADKATIDSEVKTLLSLKADYKNVTGSDWIPNAKPNGPEKTAVTKRITPEKTHALAEQISKQGDKVRDLKAKNAEKEVIKAEVIRLLELKAKYKNETGEEYAPAQPKKEAKPKENKPKEQKKDEKQKDKKPKEQSPKPKDESGSAKKITRLGLEASKDVDLPEWYSQVITKSEMIEYYDISGCYILRPWSFAIWDHIRDFLSTNFKKLGVKDCYFPIFVSKAALEREKSHIADFAPEVAWVTHSGETALAEHIAVRPTSETVMYPAYAKWVQSHRDLPLRLNQWNNVVRWEFKQPQPFIRTREFLWQEGHTAFLTQEEAGEEVLQILDLYAAVYEDLLAIPVIKGRKSEKEKFAGGDYTTTVEAYVPASGRGIQGATSHHLGQNFSKMFEIIYDDPETQEKKYVYQNSWGLTTRTIGVMILVHGDDKGLVLPPRVAASQAVVVPCGITASSSDEERATLISECKKLERELSSAGIRAEGDYRDNYSPGWKFNHWELKGVPVRLELGPKDLAKGEVVAVRRFNGEKLTFKRSNITDELKALLERTHHDMLSKATAERDNRLSIVKEWSKFTEYLELKHILLAAFCGEIPCEDNIKNDSARQDEDLTTEVKAPAMGAKSLCIPFNQPPSLPEKCIHPACKNKPKFFALFGRSY